MKHTAFILVVASSLAFGACSTPQTTTATKTTESDNAAMSSDKVEFYETEYEVRQKDYLEQLSGNWNFQTMQARLPQEDLSGITLRLNADKTFDAGLNCGKVTGSYILKGTAIKFSNVSASDCGSDEKMGELLRLLTQTVSAYTVDHNSLLLRDGSSNIIFRAAKAYYVQ